MAAYEMVLTGVEKVHWEFLFNWRIDVDEIFNTYAKQTLCLDN